MDTSHLDALRARLSAERWRLGQAKTEAGRTMLTVFVAQIEKEIRAERKFLGLPPEEEAPAAEPEALSVDELFAELSEGN